MFDPKVWGKYHKVLSCHLQGLGISAGSEYRGEEWGWGRWAGHTLGSPWNGNAVELRAPVPTDPNTRSKLETTLLGGSKQHVPLILLWEVSAEPFTQVMLNPWEDASHLGDKGYSPGKSSADEHFPCQDLPRELPVAVPTQPKLSWTNMFPMSPF